MEIRRIALNGWRNYDFASAEFSPGTNVISGENAQGKTNLLEAVYMLTGGRSFRTRFDKELIGFDCSAGEILADVFAHGREQTVKITLRRGQRKQILQNGVKKTATELSGDFAAVLFCPDDLNIIRSGAAERRKLMDLAISQLRPNYAMLLSEYNRLHEQKTSILRDWREKPSLLETLDDFSNQMSRVSAKIIRYRAAYAKRLERAAAPIHEDFAGGGEQLTMAYKTVSTVTDPLAREHRDRSPRLGAGDLLRDLRASGAPPRGGARERTVSHRVPQGRPSDRLKRTERAKLCLSGSDAHRGAEPEARRARHFLRRIR